MAVIALTGVLRDGTGDQLPVPQRISLARGEGATISLTVTKADGTPYDTTGCTIAIAIRPKGTTGASAGLPLIARRSVPVVAASGQEKFTLVSGDTVELAERKPYRYDVQLIDTASQRWQIVPESDFRVDPIVSMPGDPVSAP